MLRDASAGGRGCKLVVAGTYKPDVQLLLLLGGDTQKGILQQPCFLPLASVAITPLLKSAFQEGFAAQEEPPGSPRKEMPDQAIPESVQILPVESLLDDIQVCVQISQAFAASFGVKLVLIDTICLMGVIEAQEVMHAVSEDFGVFPMTPFPPTPNPPQHPPSHHPPTPPTRFLNLHSIEQVDCNWVLLLAADSHHQMLAQYIPSHQAATLGALMYVLHFDGIPASNSALDSHNDQVVSA